MSLKTVCTVLECRRCHKLVRQSEALVVDLIPTQYTLRCPDCNGVCDPKELKNIDGKLRRNKKRHH